MSAAHDYTGSLPGGPDRGLAGLLADASAAVGELADGADLAEMADREAAAVMGALTTMVARLDGLRVRVAATVRDRELYALRGARHLAGWLRADARLADDAWRIGRLAVMTPQLPRISGLLAEGKVTLSQAGTACWQISQLPVTVRRPDDADDPAGSADGADDSVPAASGAGNSDGDAWAGLWRAGDVHAAADQLFAEFLPAMDSGQLRQMGAHLREAADSQERAGEEYDEFRQRRLRISRSFGGAGEISGRLHPEAAARVIAASEELGAKADQDDERTKAQRWADALCRLTGTSPAGASGLPAGHGDDLPTPAEPDDEPPAGDDTWHDGGNDDDDDPRAGQPGTAAEGEHGSHAVARRPAGLQRPRVIVTVPISSLLRQPLAPGAILSSGCGRGAGAPLAAEAARRLACDAEIIRLVTDDQVAAGVTELPPSGDFTAQLTRLLAAAIRQLPPPVGGPSAALDIGRKSQGWTPRQRDALHTQYGGRCGFPRCGGPIEVIHHIFHWADGGPTSVTNGLPECLYHHWLIHEGGWRIKKFPDGTIIACPPPAGWRPGTIYRRGAPAAGHGPPPGSG